MIVTLSLILACLVPLVPADFLLVSVYNEGIYRVDIKDGTKTRLPILSSASQKHVLGATFDASTSRVLWCEEFNDGLNISILAAKVDGSEHTVVKDGVSSPMFALHYDAGAKRLYFNDGGIGYIDTTTLMTSTIVSSATRHFAQLLLYGQNKLIYVPDMPERYKVMQVNRDGSGPKEVFSISSAEGIHFFAFAVTPLGDKIFACGNRGHTAHLYVFTTATGVLYKFGTLQDFLCTGLATDGQRLYIKDNWSNKIYVTPERGPGAPVPLTKSLFASPTPSLPKAVGFEYVKEPVPATTAATTAAATRKPTPATTVCGHQDANPLCPRLANDGKCSLLDVQKYCKKSCLC